MKAKEPEPDTAVLALLLRLAVAKVIFVAVEPFVVKSSVPLLKITLLPSPPFKATVFVCAAAIFVSIIVAFAAIFNVPQVRATP